MFRRCQLRHCNMSIGTACRVMGFRTPPVNKKQLKKRFVELAKVRHPDQHAEDRKGDATAQMVKLTEAYKALKKLLDAGVCPSGPHTTQAAAAASMNVATGASSGVNSHVEDVAASFVTPGSSLSMRGFTLPWQKCTSSVVDAAAEAKLDCTVSQCTFSEYVSTARAVEKERKRREARADQDAEAAGGSHGYTAEYFANVNSVRDELKRDGRSAFMPIVRRWMRPTGVVPLACSYYGKKLKAYITGTPKRIRDSLRYIVSGV